MRERDPTHPTAVAIGIPTGADDEIFRHARSELTLSRKISKQLSPPLSSQFLAPNSKLPASGRQKNFSGVRIFHRRSGRKTAHVDVTSVWRERTRDKAFLARHRRSIPQILTFFGRCSRCRSGIAFARWRAGPAACGLSV